jgi:hypothetical protein
MRTLRLLDVVALLSDTVVEILDHASEIEFSDDDGKTYAELAVAADQLLVLHQRLQRAGSSDVVTSDRCSST